MNAEARRAIRELSGATNVGVSYVEYRRRLADAAAAIEGAGTPDDDQVRTAMEYFKMAASLWEMQINRHKYSLEDVTNAVSKAANVRCSQLSQGARDASSSAELKIRNWPFRLDPLQQITVHLEYFPTLIKSSWQCGGAEVR